MRKTLSSLFYTLWVLTILHPAGIILSACFGYSFKLFSIPAFSALIAILSCLVVVFSLAHNAVIKKALNVLIALLLPLSVINAAFCVFRCFEILTVVCMLFSVGCAFFMTIKHGKPLALKIITLLLSGLSVLPILFLSFIVFIAGSMSEDTVIKTVESPNGSHYAEVVDSDQGALGGNTLVLVHESVGVDAFIFKIEREPQQVYIGEWGEFENMEIYWKDNTCLVINSVEHEID